MPVKQKARLYRAFSIIETDENKLITIIYLSFLKLPTTIQEIMPFVIILSTAFYYRHLISNNEFISMRNIGYSIIDIFRPVGFAIFFIGICSLIVLNPLYNFILI